MNTLKIHNLLIGLAALSGLLLTNFALADDLTPPPYRGAPLSVHGHWNLVPGTTLLNLTASNSVDDNDPTTTLHPAPFSVQVLPNSNHAYQFQLPNWIDNMPIKYMRVQLTWLNSAQPPISVLSQALDGTNTIFGSVTFISPVLTTPTGIGNYQYFDLIFKPNPDYERVLVQMPSDGILSQVVIDTVSTIPEPATMALLGLGGLLLRKRIK